MKVAEFIAELGFELRGEGDLRKFNEGMGRTEKRVSAFAATIARWGAVAGAAIGAGMAGLAKSVIGTSAQFEGFEVALTTIEGSAEKARASMDWIQDFAKKTPYDLAGVTDAFIRLKSYGIDAADGTLRVLGDAASAMNKPLLAAVEMFADASTFQFERLREFGIVASQKGDEVTFRWNKNGKELTRIVAKNSDEVRKFLVENFGDRFNGAMLRQSKTWNGMISNLGDSWEDFKLRIGRGGFFDTVKNRLADFLDYIDDLDANGTLDAWSQSLSDGFETAVDVTERAVKRLLQVGKLIAGLFGSDSALWGLTAFAGALLVRAFPLAAGIALIAAALEDLWTYLEGGESVIGKFLADYPALEAGLQSLAGWGKSMAEALGPLAGYIVPAMAAAGAFALLAPALRGLASAVAMLSGLKLAWGLIAWLAALSGVSAKGAAGIGALGAALSTIAAGVASFGAMLLTSGSTPDNEYVNADEATRAKMREDARTDAATYNGDYDSFGPRNPRRGHFRGEEEREQSLDSFLDGPPKPPQPTLPPQPTKRPQPSVPSIPSERSGKGDRLGRAEPSPSRFGHDVDLSGLKATVESINGHLATMTSDAVSGGVNATITDARQDNRQFPVTTTVHVGGVTVQQAAQAPGAVGAAVGAAAASAVNGAAAQPSRMQTGPVE